MAFEGFEVPNFTLTPNFFFDEIVLQKGVTIAEVKIVSFMIRMTYGWQRQGNVLQFTFDDLQKAVQLGREAVNNGLKKCLESKWIQRKEIKGKLLYRLHIKSFADYPWELEFQWKKVFKFAEKQEENPQFENRTTIDSSEIELEPVRKSNCEQFGNRTENEAQTHDTQGIEAPLNKSLNKSLNKKEREEEEEESNLSFLVSFFLQNIDSGSNKKFIESKFAKWLKILPYEVIKRQLEICKENDAYTWTFVENAFKRLQDSNVTTIEQLEQKQVRNHNSNVKNSSNGQSKAKRKELLPDWYEDPEKYYGGAAAAAGGEDPELEAKKRAIEEKLMAFRNR